jgi:hypothetical protein
MQVVQEPVWDTVRARELHRSVTHDGNLLSHCGDAPGNTRH